MGSGPWQVRRKRSMCNLTGTVYSKVGGGTEEHDDNQQRLTYKVKSYRNNDIYCS